MEDLIHSILKRIWALRALEREFVVANDALDSEVGAGTSKKNRTTSANASALKVTCELLRIFISEAVQRAADIAEAEGLYKPLLEVVDDNSIFCTHRVYKIEISESEQEECGVRIEHNMNKFVFSFLAYFLRGIITLSIVVLQL